MNSAEYGQFWNQAIVESGCSEEMVLQMPRGAEESPLRWSEADWEHCVGQSAGGFGDTG